MGGALSGQEAGGGSTPQMDAWNQFTLGENQTANAQAFGRGMPVSTGVTYADIGSQANEVKMQMKQDDAIRAANQAGQNANKSVTDAGIGAVGQVVGGLGGLLGRHLMGGGIGGFGSGNSPGNIQESDIRNAMDRAGMSADATVARYQQLGLGGVGATPSGATSGATPGIPGSGTTPVNPGQFATGSTTVGGPGGPGGPGGAGGAAGGAGVPGGPTLAGTAEGGGAGLVSPGGGAGGGFSVPTGGPTAMEMELGVLPSRTGGIPEMFQAVLGETQFQDIGQTTQSATGAQQAKAQGISSIGSLGGSLLGGLGGI